MRRFFELLALAQFGVGVTAMILSVALDSAPLAVVGACLYWHAVTGLRRIYAKEDT